MERHSKQSEETSFNSSLKILSSSEEPVGIEQVLPAGIFDRTSWFKSVLKAQIGTDMGVFTPESGATH